MQILETYWNDPRVLTFRNSEAFPYVRGLAVIAGIAATVSVVALVLFAAGPFLLSVAEGTFVIAEWSLIASGLTAAGYYVKGYLEQFYDMVQLKIDSILNKKK